MLRQMGKSSAMNRCMRGAGRGIHGLCALFQAHYFPVQARRSFVYIESHVHNEVISCNRARTSQLRISP